MTAFLKTDKSKISIDIDTIIYEIKCMLEEHVITTSKGLPFYGKIITCFEEGELTHIEKYETVK